MRSLFYNDATFNQDISEWDVSNVTDMWHMFEGAAAFNQDISEWNTSKVINMSCMFQSAPAFNQPIGGWNVSKVIYMDGMFEGAAVSTGYLRMEYLKSHRHEQNVLRCRRSQPIGAGYFKRRKLTNVLRCRSFQPEYLRLPQASPA